MGLNTPRLEVSVQRHAPLWLGPAPWIRSFSFLGVLLTTIAGEGGEPRPVAVARPEDADLTDDVQRLLYLARERPIFLQLHVRVDGRSLHTEWRNSAKRMFEEFDRNADGILTESEWDAIPDSDVLIEGKSRGTTQGTNAIRETIDREPTDGIITLDEFTSYLLAHGARAMQVVAMGSGDGPGQAQRGVVPPSAGNRLFLELDRDRDGGLSAVELTGGAGRIAELDFDDDGSMSPGELFAAPTVVESIGAALSGGSSRPAVFVAVPASGPLDNVCRRLFDQYDRMEDPADGTGGPGTDDRLTRDEFPIPQEIFENLDRNHDGALDFAELQEIARQEFRGLTITVRIGQRLENELSIEVQKTDPALQSEIQRADSGKVDILLGGERLELAIEPAHADTRVREALMKAFEAADRDQNAYLERSEAMRTLFGIAFDTMDEDSDGKLFASEFMAYVARREAAAASRCQLAVATDGRNLFDILDLNRDGRITPRELQGAPRRTAAWDVNGDAKLSPDEVPAHYRLIFGKSRPEIPGLDSIVAEQSSPSAPRRSAPRGPIWFQRMDRNHDGEVLRREFLGPPAQFDRYDVNRDGLIDEQEALAGSSS